MLWVQLIFAVFPQFLFISFAVHSLHTLIHYICSDASTLKERNEEPRFVLWSQNFEKSVTPAKVSNNKWDFMGIVFLTGGSLIPIPLWTCQSCNHNCKKCKNLHDQIVDPKNYHQKCVIYEYNTTFTILRQISENAFWIHLRTEDSFTPSVGGLSEESLRTTEDTLADLLVLISAVGPHKPLVSFSQLVPA